MTILGVNGTHLININVSNPILVTAKVAGFDSAQFGLKETKYYPLLFNHKKRSDSNNFVIKL